MTPEQMAQMNDDLAELEQEDRRRLVREAASDLLEACQIALMNLEMNSFENDYALTKMKLRRAIKNAGGEEWVHPQAHLKTRGRK